MFKKLSILLLVTISIGSLAVSGCWSRQEVENLAIADSFGIDVENFNGKPKYKVTCNIFKPAQGGGGGGGGSSMSPQGPPIWQIIAFGDTFQDAIANIAIRSPRDLFVGHLKLVVISKDVAKQGIQEIVDYLLRNHEIRLRTWLVVVDGKAQDALRAMPDLDPTIGDQSAEIAARTRNSVSKYYTENLNEFVSALGGEGEEPVLGRVELIQPTPPQVGTENVTTALAFSGIAAFSGDKFAGWLEDNETKGFLYIIGQSRRGVIPVSVGQGRPTVSLEMENAQSKIKAEMVNGKLYVRVEIKAKGSLREEGKNQELVSPQGMEGISGIFAKEIKELCMKSVKKAQRYKTDIFGFGAALHRKNPGQWREVKNDWPAVFAQAEVDIEIEAHITNTGQISERVQPKK